MKDSLILSFLSGAQETSVKVFNALTGECLHTLAGLEFGIVSLSFSPLGIGKMGAIAAGGWDGRIMVWDVEVSVSLSVFDTAMSKR